MKIQMILNDKEKEMFKKLGSALVEGDTINTAIEDIKAPNRKWGEIKSYTVEIYEPCLEDAINLSIAIIPKIKGLFTFAKSLMPLIKGAFTAFSDKWGKDLDVLDIPNNSPVIKANGANSVSASTTETSNSNNTPAAEGTAQGPKAQKKHNSSLSQGGNGSTN